MKRYLAVALTCLFLAAGSVLGQPDQPRSDCLRQLDKSKKKYDDLVLALECLRSELFAQTAGGGTELPKYAVVAFNAPECPQGWRPLETARGRYIVGLTPGGTLGGTVGRSLTDQENRVSGKHTHDYDAFYVGGSGGEIEWGKDARRQGESRASSPAGEVQGTNAPYVQLLVCEKI